MYILVYIDPKDMNWPSFNSSWRDESNEPLFIKLGSLDAEIITNNNLIIAFIFKQKSAKIK